MLNTKKNKSTNINRLPNLYRQTLIRSENDYQREIRRKLDQLQHINRDTERRRQANEHLFAHEHLAKRYQWFNLDKTYRDVCRTKWNKQIMGKTRTSHIFLPSIYTTEKLPLLKNSFEIQKDENSVVADEKIKQKFLYIQPVMLEILNAPHSSKIFKCKHEIELRKISAQRRQKQIQKTAINDPRYRQLVLELQDN